MIVVSGLVWDEWNREHLARHSISPEEVEEVCHGKYKISESYRKRLLIVGKTTRGRKIAIVLSPQDRSLKYYDNGVYYVITAFEKEV
ncbi:hypothetical protein KJ980_03570 [Patescibacteria group bacterium]|nr:hypothetical protein [Patescibacteria group bacterium]MBU4016773.1 hypothetical protein [Patescibacteria group bacterium]MBU4098701.1 hypothetical protein [Patescibacteria group bacterium]